MREATDALQRCRAISPRGRALQAHYSPSGGGEGGWVGAKITEIRLRRCSAQVKYKLMISKSILRYLANFYAFCRSFSKTRLYICSSPTTTSWDGGREKYSWNEYVTNVGEGLQHLGLRSEPGGVCIVPHPPWPRPRVLQSLPKGRLHLVTLYGKRRTMRTYSNRDPHQIKIG